MVTRPGILGLSAARNAFLLLAGLGPLFSADPQNNKIALDCPGGRAPVRAPAIHTESSYALACAGASGVWEGPYQERFEDGALAASGHYKAGQPDGNWTFFYPNGSTMKRGPFRSGRREGQWTSFYQNGRKLGQGTYRDDALDGEWTEWYENGARKSQGAYRNGEETGRWTYWYPNGQRDRTGSYMGRRIVPPRNISLPAESGKWTYWYETGGKRAEGCFRNGERIAIWTEWSNDGQVTSAQKYGSANAADVPCR